MVDKFRIHGSQLGVNELYVDAKVTDTTVEGVISLEDESDGSRTWETHVTEFAEWRQQNLAINIADLDSPNSDIWKGLQDVYAMREDSTIEEISERVGVSMTDIFTALVEIKKGA